MPDIILGNLKFYWRGNWASSTSYDADDVVKYGPNVYVCITAHTSQATFDPDSAKWELMAAGLENAGVWNGSTLYKVGQTVTYGGAVYIALQESTNANPYSETSVWQLFVDGQQFKDEWDSGTSYVKGDIVTYGGYAYVAKQNTTNNNPTDTTYWDVHVKGFQFRGSYSPVFDYRPGDVVGYGGNFYIVKEGERSLGQHPSASAKFTKFIEGLRFRGDYATDVEYEPNDLVRYGGKVYRFVGLDSDQDTYPGEGGSGVSEISVTVGVSTRTEDSTVAGQSTGVFYMDGQERPVLDLTRGRTYLFDQSDSTNLTYGGLYHTLMFDTIRDGDLAGGGHYMTGVTYRLDGSVVTMSGYNTGFQSATTRTVEFTVPQGAPDTLYYWCHFHVGQGNSINIRDEIAGASLGGDSLTPFHDIGEIGTPEFDEQFDLFADGVTFVGEYTDAQGYKAGEIVRHGGRSYVCIEGYENDGSSTPAPPNTDYWKLLSDGFEWKGSWNVSNEYKINDVVEYAQSSYISLTANNIGNTPTDGAPNWNLVAQGDSNAIITTRGDLLTRDATQAVRLPIGPAGSFLTSNGTDLTWGHLTPQNDYYVSPQGDDSNDGRTAITSWKTIKHAAEQTFNLGQCRINVSSGTYAEQCPIRVGRSVVLEGNGLGAVTIQPDTTNDNGFGQGISDDGSTPNANSHLFLMNNGCRMRNFVFRNFSTGSVLVSLDPGTGPDDTSVWITSQSPYVQNCTSFTPGGTGFKIDGGLHNGGYKSMVANDWTQINSDGVGIHVLNDGRTELVSCFTYYCDIGYLAESGGKIRALVGNNSYGEYGAIARGFSQSETPLTGNLQLDNKTIDSVTQIASNVHVFTSYRDSIGNRFFVGHTAPTGTDVTSTFNNGASYPFVCKFNSAGSLDWIYTYESTYGAIHSAVELSDRIYCGGVIYDGANKGFILSISKAGEIQWQKSIGNTTEIVDLATDGNSLYAVGTHSTTGSSVTKLNPAGVEQWSRTLEYNDSSAANTLVATSCTVAGTPTTSVDTYALAGDATAEGNVYVSSYDSTANQSVITRISSSGDYVATYQYGDVGINKLRLDTGNGDGIYLMAVGYYDPAGAVTKTPIAFRLNVAGVVQWQKQYANGSEEGEWKDVLPFGDDIYIAGYQNEGTNNNNTGLLGRISSTGQESWIQKFDNGTNNIALNGVMLDGVNVIAAGIEQGDSVIVNVQRDETGGVGTVSSGSYNIATTSQTVTDSTVVQQQFNEIDQASVTLGSTDQGLTLNQSPTQTRTVAATRAGFAGIGTGVLFTIDGLSRQPKEGSVLQITGDTETYFVIGVDYNEDAGSASVQIEPPVPSNKTPDDNTSVVFREAYSQVRMTGHDFLDIGTGGFADTNYPVIISDDYTQKPDQTRETLSELGGRVFYVTTDQDGNFRVGDYFKVEQATGRATLSSEEFDLSGLNELQLGSITAGRQGATVNEFSTDGTFADNSDTAVPTEKAVKTYVDNEIEQAIAGAGSIVAGTIPNQSKVEVVGTGVSGDTIDFDIAGTQVLRVDNTGLVATPNGTEILDVDSTTGLTLSNGGDILFKAGTSDLTYNISGATTVLNANTTGLQVSPGGTLSFEAAEQFMLVPAGSTANRPGSPSNGYLRYNTTLNAFEGYVNGAWSGIGGGNPWIFKTNADSPYSAANNDRIFVDTSGGAVTVTLPSSPNTGDSVRIVDMAGNFGTHNLTVARNGSNIMGSASDLTSSTDNEGFLLVYSNSTYGWILQEL